MDVGSVNLSAALGSASGTSCTTCYAEHRDAHIAKAGLATDAIRAGPSFNDAFRLAIEARIGEQAPAMDQSETREQAVARGLTHEEQTVVDQLKLRDREVRDHEQAHARVGGPYAGEPSYTYQTGPDGNRYAIGGEVPIDIAPIEGDPEATIEKTEVVKAAALAPAEPSGQDRKVAALAETQKLQALADLAELRRAVNDTPLAPSLDIAA